ncbi:MAG: MBL fold metallo-hydrolase [Acidobacteria bacterium]|nr:MBL fold metallo-hydrolase [Acidobacteriota bacterium]
MTIRFPFGVPVACLALAMTLPVSAQQPQRPPVRAITRIAGDLYRVQDSDHYTMFLVTPAGIILADPISADAATWLKAQLTARFPNAPVRYVLYSHHHQDHASGAAVFNDTAEIVGHENFAAALAAAAGQNAVAAKRYAAVLPPESTYRDRRTIALGGRRVEMIYAGRTGHAPDLTILHFPAERVVFGADFMAVRTVPGSNTMGNGAPIEEYVNALKRVEALDFDIAAPGHGPVGTRRDIADHRRYFEQIAARVSQGIKAGRTLDELQAAKIMDEFREWIEYDEDNDVNIANAYKTLSAPGR